MAQSGPLRLIHMRPRDAHGPGESYYLPIANPNEGQNSICVSARLGYAD